MDDDLVAARLEPNRATNRAIGEFGRLAITTCARDSRSEIEGAADDDRFGALNDDRILRLADRDGRRADIDVDHHRYGGSDSLTDPPQYR